MPISHKYKLIFIHIPKCAGISIWHALDLTVSESNLISAKAPVLQHLLPEQLKGKYIDTKTFDSYKKFTIIRNPYERVVSDYFWMKNTVEASHLVTGNFDDFLSLREDIVNNKKYEEDLYYDHFYPMHFYFEQIEYDHVIRFENIEEGYSELRKLYAIENTLPKDNQSARNGFILNEQQRDRIYALYEKDFLQFGYDRLRDKKNDVLLNNEKNSQTMPNSEPTTAQLNDFFVQLFWKQGDADFSEKSSITRSIIFNNELSTVCFTLPAIPENIGLLRFDIGNRVGVINIHKIIIKDNLQNIVWDFDKQPVLEQHNLLFIESNNNLPDKRIQFSTSDDPHFIVEISSELQKQIQNGFTVEISLSPLDIHQTLMLRTPKAPLTFISKKEHLTLLENEKILIQEREQLQKEVVDKNNYFSEILAKNDIQFNQLKEIHNAEIISVRQERDAIEVQKKQIHDENQNLLSAVAKAVEVSNNVLNEKQELELKLNTLAIEQSKIVSEIKKFNEELLIALNNNSNLTKTIDTKNTQLLELNGSLAKLSKDIENSKQANNNLETLCKTEREQKNNLSLELITAGNNNSNLAKTIDTKNAQLLELNGSLAQLSKDIEISKQTTNNLETLYQTEREQKNNLSLQLTIALNTVSALAKLTDEKSTQLSELNDSVKKLSGEIEISKQTTNNLEILYKTEREQKNNLSLQLATALNTVSNLTKLTDTKSAQLSELNDSVKRLSAELEISKQENTHLEILYETERKHNLANKENIVQQNELLKQFDNFYEKKNLLQIILNRAVGKKISS